MSEKGCMDVEVELIGCEGIRGAAALMEVAEGFASSNAGWRAIRRGDEVRLEASSEHADRLEREMAGLGDELAGLEVPPEGWIARVSYTDFELEGDGRMVWLIVAGGRIARYEESVVTFAGKEPPFEFDMRRGGGSGVPRDGIC